MLIPTPDLISKYLKLAVGIDRQPLLTDAQVAERAVAIHEEVVATKFPLVLTTWVSGMTTGAYPKCRIIFALRCPEFAAKNKGIFTPRNGCF